MEKVEYHTPEEKKACGLIRYYRRYGRTRHCNKNIDLNIDEEEGLRVSSRTQIGYHKQTGHINIYGGLRYCGTEIYPTKNSKLRCINKNAINALYQREQIMKRPQQRINFSETIAPYIRFDENITFFKDTGGLMYSSWFRGVTTKRNGICWGRKLKIINELDDFKKNKNRSGTKRRT